jgi:rubrerythrin
MSTEVIYARVPSATKEAAEAHAAARGITLTNAVSELLDRGLQAISDEPSVTELDRRIGQLQHQLAAADLERREAEMTVRALREREAALASAYQALAERTAQSIGACPHCGQPVSGHDLLVTGRCGSCSGGLVSLITPAKQSKGALDETEFKVLLGAVGLALAMALVQGAGSSA